jgi:hypothetical protein
MKKLQQDLNGIRAGRSIVELDEDRSGKISVSISRKAYARLSRLAKQKKVPIGIVIEQLVDRNSF